MADEEDQATEDKELMERIASGNQQAYRILVSQYLPKAHAVARRFLSQREDAEEVIQDVFLQVWIHAPAFNPDKASFGTWFYRMLANKCLDRIRRRKARSETPSDETLLNSIPDNMTLAQDDLIMQSEEGMQVRTAVQSLPERQRLAVILCYFGELTNPRAAEAMGLKLKALEGLLVRARRSLREKLSTADAPLASCKGRENALEESTLEPFREPVLGIDTVQRENKSINRKGRVIS